VAHDSLFYLSIIVYICLFFFIMLLVPPSPLSLKIVLFPACFSCSKLGCCYSST
jgi:hypothetical protein